MPSFDSLFNAFVTILVTIDPPGLRADYGDNYYAAFVIDPDGYRLEAYCGAAG